MKEITAYMRRHFLDVAIKELENAGAKDITVIRVDAIGEMADTEMDRWHLVRKHEEKYSSIAKVEIFCLDEQAVPFMEIIRRVGHTGEHGDGRIFVSNVENAVNIRTGERGSQAL